MKQLLYTIGAILMMMPLLTNGQGNPCGTDFNLDMTERLKQNIKAIKDNSFTKSGVVTYVPVKVHIVGQTGGGGKVPKHSVFTMLCKLNSVYNDQDIQFYISGIFNEFDSNVLYSHSNTSGARAQMALKKANNAMNIFMCGNLNSSNTLTPGTTLGYFLQSNDVLAMRNDQANSNSYTLAHEAGHFFSLAHPHNGWEVTPYHNLNDGANQNPVVPITFYGPNNLPPTSINGVTVELADGSNCTTAGDMLCDTPPDYNFGFTNNGCVYTGNGVDPTGAPVQPDETNIMSYFTDNCMIGFSPSQKNVVSADLNNFTRNYLTNNPPTATTKVTGVTNLVSPANLGTPANYDNVTLDWDDVPDATNYLVQISLTTGFSQSSMVEDVMVNSSSYISTGLSANRSYFWRVMAYNEITTCNTFSTSRRFITSSNPVSVQDIQGLNEVTLRPNATASGRSVTLEVGTTNPFDATVRVYNIAGQMVKGAENVRFENGTTNYQIETTDLTPGVYIVNVLADSGMVSRKLVITN